MRKKIVACDIDGTISADGNPISEQIIQFLSEAESAGWIILFVTGRTITWAKKAIDTCLFPCFIAPFNGSALWEKDAENRLQKRYVYPIQNIAVQEILSLMKKYGGVVYSGEKIGATPSPSKKIWDHMQMRSACQEEVWEPLTEDFFSQNIDSMRIFFTQEQLLEMAVPIEQYLRELGLYPVFVKDSFSSEFVILQISNNRTSKKTPIDWFKEHYVHVSTIAIGNDLNDIPLLEVADIAIAVIDDPTSPLASISDFVVPGVFPEEIIKTIKRAMEEIL